MVIIMFKLIQSTRLLFKHENMCIISCLCAKEELEGKVSEEESSADEDEVQSDPQPVARQQSKPSRVPRHRQRGQTQIQTKTELIDVTDRVAHLNQFQPEFLFSEANKSVDGDLGVDLGVMGLCV
jgi:hypothetical protein